MKRLLSMFLATIMLLGILAIPRVSAAVISTEDEVSVTGSEQQTLAPQEEEEPQTEEEPRQVFLPFSDVKESHWFYEDVTFVYSYGLMNGMGDGKFLPDRTLSRAEVVTVLHRLSGSPKAEGENPFKDVAKNLYYYEPVLWASQVGLVNGLSPKEFGPDDSITREQIATIFYRYYTQFLGLSAEVTGDLTQFPDEKKVSDYAREGLSWTVGVELMRGIAHGDAVHLEPQSTTTRAQLAALLCRLCALEGVPMPELRDDQNRVTDQIIAFIKKREGFEADPYWDYSQWTVGYGTYCTDDQGNRVTNYNDKNKISKEYFGMTEETAEALLRQRLAEEYESTVAAFEKKYDLTFDQGQFDALVSFTFNLGSSWTSSNYKISRCLSGQEEYADGYTDLEFMDAFGSWCRVGGNVATGTCDRRLREAAIFLNEDYAYENGQFCFVRYKGNGSYLSTSVSTGNRYTDAIDYFLKGSAYGALLEPEWNPVEETHSDSEMQFLGWFTSENVEVTAETLVEENFTLTAKWGEE